MTDERQPVSPPVTVNTIGGKIEMDGFYTGMTSDVGAAHLDGLAGLGEPADVLIPLDVSGSTEGFFFGSGVFTTEQLPGVARGSVYVNVHTADNAPGEIRGQFPEQVDDQPAWVVRRGPVNGSASPPGLIQSPRR